MNWLNEIGLKYIEDARLGSNYVEATELHNAHNQFEREHNKVRYSKNIDFAAVPNEPCPWAHSYPYRGRDT